MLKYGNSEIVVAVEFGTSKICVAIGESDESGNIILLGHGERSPDDSIFKGEITDMDKAMARFREALSDAEESADMEITSENIYVGVTGNHIRAYQGVGSELISHEERVITEDHINTAMQNAQIVSHQPDERLLDAIGGHFMIDGKVRSENPLNQVAHKLEVHSHVIYGNNNRIETFLTPLRDVGLDKPIPVFCGIASAFPVISDEEHKQGTLFIDMGAGTTEYITFYNPGVLSSGMLSVGCDHIANDLAIALELPLNPVCRDMLIKSLSETESKLQFLEVSGALGNRKIPMQTVQKVIDMRLRETFEIMKKRLDDDGLLQKIGAGIVFTGGGALIPAAEDILKEVFKLPVRVVGNSVPTNFGGAISGLESPRYTTLLGLLLFGLMSSNSGSLINKLDRGLNTLIKSFFKKTWEVLKF